MTRKKTFSEYTPKSRSDLFRWLARNHRKSESVWIVIFKKGALQQNLNSVDVAEVSLCFGWIDSVPNKIDHEKFKLLISPRRRGSLWSQVNKARIKKLIQSGEMSAPGIIRIQEAKDDGTWFKTPDSTTLQMPADLQRALKKNKKANAFFAELNRSSQRPIFEWIVSAKKPNTRESRIKEAVWLAAKGLRANNYFDRDKIKRLKSLKK